MIEILEEDLFDCQHYSDEEVVLFDDSQHQEVVLFDDSQQRLMETLTKIKERIPPLINGLREKISLLEDEAERRLRDYQSLYEHMCEMRERALKAEDNLKIIISEIDPSSDDAFDSEQRYNYPSKSLEEVVLEDHSSSSNEDDNSFIIISNDKEDIPMECITTTPSKNKAAIRRRLQTLRSLK